MKGKILSLNENWVISVISTNNSQLNLFETNEEENYINKVFPIYALSNIDTKNWKGGEIFNGEIFIVKEKFYFKIKNDEVKYLDFNNKKEFCNTKTYILLMGWLCNNNHIAITQDQYQYLLNIAKNENVISSYFSNGFCINYKYVVYGKLTTNKQIIYPQIKIK